MMSDAGRALHLKEEGNRLFTQKNYTSAEAMYSKAIISDPKNPTLYTNRAMARIKLGLWDNVVDDCLQTLRLDPSNMKAFYQQSQAQLELGAYDDSVDSARRALELCARTHDRSIANIANQLRKALSARWDHGQRQRVRDDKDLEGETTELFERRKCDALASCVSDVERSEVAAEWDAKIQRLAEIFDKARPEEQRRKEKPPHWLQCPISFQLMLDPVVTRAGHTYDRQSIEEHVKHHQIDPYTREPLYLGDLRPNLAVKAACEEYLRDHGYAAEY